MLCQAITWPAAWLHEKGLHLPPQRYERLVTNRLDDIKAHGNPYTCRAYFPRYLMHCLQQWFLHNGDALCDELRHVRNQLWQVDAIVQAIQKSQPPDHAYTQHMAQAHHRLNGQQRRKKSTENTHQLTLL